jgi:hypothetical protein
MGKTGTLLASLGLVAAGCTAEAQVPDAEGQLASALLAAPEDRRAGATVIGFDGEGKAVTLREGDNDLVCLSDYTLADGWSTSCYHESLDPYMARGRQLREEGVDGQARLQQRWDEIEAGTLAYPEAPTTLYVLHGEGYDAASGQVVEPYLRWVIYTPFATPESTGLQTAPAPNAPWLMFPGTVGAHIMITPPRPGS